MAFWQEEMIIGLASKSPRRQQLLKESKFNFVLLSNEMEEVYPSSLMPHQVPAFLAKKKALQVEFEPSRFQVILAADVVVIKDGHVLGKPIDKNEAAAMLFSLQGAWHSVITGVTLRSNRFLKTFSVKTEVEIGAMSEEEIFFYVDRCFPLDKAGAYGIQEWIGHCKVKTIQGSYTNVMGLPMYEVYEHLLAFHLHNNTP